MRRFFILLGSLVLILIFLSSCVSLRKINNAGKISSDELSDAHLSPEIRKKVESLLEKPEINKALTLIEEYDDVTIENQIELTEIEAPPFKEHLFGKSDFLLDLFQKYGSDSTWIDSIGNVYSLTKGRKSRTKLIVSAHMDTVFPEGTDVKVHIKNDTLFAPGVADDNRGLAAMLTVMRVIKESGIDLNTDILFVGTVGEEGLGDLRGVKYLFQNLDPTEVIGFISLESGSINWVNNLAIGSHRYRITFEGPGGHSWSSFGLGNPIHYLGQAVSIFTDNADRFLSEGGGKTSFNIGRIGGGTSVNSIPFSAWMEVDMRSVNQERLNKIDEILHESIQSAVSDQNKQLDIGPQLTYKIEKVGDRPSGETSVDEELIQLGVISSQILGSKPKLVSMSTDSNIPISLDIPAMTIGSGGVSGNSHSLNEWYFNKDGYIGIQRILMIIMGLTSSDS